MNTQDLIKIFGEASEAKFDKDKTYYILAFDKNAGANKQIIKLSLNDILQSLIVTPKVEEEAKEKTKEEVKKVIVEEVKEKPSTTTNKPKRKTKKAKK